MMGRQDRDKGSCFTSSLDEVIPGGAPVATDQRVRDGRSLAAHRSSG